LGRWYCEVLRAATDPRDECADGVCFQNGAVKDPGTISEGMVRLDLTAFDSEPECSRTDAEAVRGLGQVHPPF
jgi:hypothetical protein